jgi:hypothetical protein
MKSSLRRRGELYGSRGVSPWWTHEAFHFGNPAVLLMPARTRGFASLDLSSFAFVGAKSDSITLEKSYARKHL